MIKTIKNGKMQIDTGGLEFVTDEGVNVTKRIQKRLTDVFIKKEDAENLAKRKKSYVYEVGFYEKNFDKKFEDSGDRIVKPYGFAVPK